MEKLFQNAFAYYLGNEEQRLGLSKVFKCIAQKVVFTVGFKNATYFARSLYGIDVSNQVLQWVDENIEILEKYSSEDLIAAIIGLFVELFPDKAKVGTSLLVDVLQLWTAGLPYVGICSSIGKQLTINQLEKICNNTLSFHLCFLIGDRCTEDFNKTL